MQALPPHRLAAAVCAALASAPAPAETFFVTSTADSGPGSLREAIALTRANDEADVVDLSAISGQTVSLTGIQLYFNYDEVTLEGAGATIDGAGNSRIFSTLVVDFALRDVTLTGGDSAVGGALYHYFGDLSLDNVTITGSSSDLVGGAVAILDEGDRLSMRQSVITGNVGRSAGGLYFTGDGDVEIEESIISGNEATGAPTRARLPAMLDRPDPLAGRPVLGGWRGNGGGFGAGLIAAPRVGLRRSTIADNRAAAQVGGLLIRAGHAEIDASTVAGNVATGPVGGLGVLADYEAVITNSTVSGNRSLQSIAGGVYSGIAPGAGLRASFVTVTANRAAAVAGWYALGEAGDRTEFSATVVGGNQAPTIPDLAQNPEGTIFASFSLLGNAPPGGLFDADGVTAALLGSDPALAPLAGNGGPTTTHRPLPGSPIIDLLGPGQAGCGAGFDIDQRGRPRPAGAGCEAGAVEFEGDVFEVVAVPVIGRGGLVFLMLALGLAAGWWLGAGRGVR